MRLVFVIAGGAAALRAGPRLARPSRSLSRATRSGSPSRLSAPSSWPGPCCAPASGRAIEGVEESGFWSVLTIRSLRRAAESVIHSDPTRRDDHCSRAYPGYVMALTCRLQGPPPGDRSPQLRVWGQSAHPWCQPSHWGLPRRRRRRRCPFTRPHSSQRMRSSRGAESYSHQSTSWQVRRPPVSAGQASSSMASLVAARRALTAPRRADGSCMLSKCYSERERPRGPADRSASVPQPRAPRSDSGPSGRRTAALAL